MASTDTPAVTFADLGLDPRLLQAVADLGWALPTKIQARTVGLALKGKDVLARARTGSGKTGAYALPLLQRLLVHKMAMVEADGAHGVAVASGSNSDVAPASGVRALVLVPTKELAAQAMRDIQQLAAYCSKDVCVVKVTGEHSMAEQKAALDEEPDIVVSTPARIMALLRAQVVSVKATLDTLVVDEADLAFSYGYEDDMRALVGYLPNICQTFLISATLNTDVETLSDLVLHNATTVELDESLSVEDGKLTQSSIRCDRNDRFLLVYTLLKLKILAGKTIIFVAAIDTSYRLKLFLEKFSLKSCVLNSELPQKSRNHVVDEFNRGVYDWIIATDESRQSMQKPQKKKKGKKGAIKDIEYGVARGIDFRDVANVVNFDFPADPDAYTHRVGRTARGGKSGSALSFICDDKDAEYMDNVDKAAKERASLGKNQNQIEDNMIRPFKFNEEIVNSFRYRAVDALQSVTPGLVKDARMKEIKREILNSEQLRAHFEDNPTDMRQLRHDNHLQPHKIQQHLKSVPAYLLQDATGSSSSTIDTGAEGDKASESRVPFRGNNKRRRRGDNNHRGGSSKRRKQGKGSDPLKSFKYKK